MAAKRGTRAKTPAKGKAKRGGKKSRAESMTGKKAAEVEGRTGELELKEVEIDDGDFDMHFRALKGATDRMKTAKNLFDGCCKAAKKVSPELLDAVKRAIKFEGMDTEDIKRQLQIDGYVLRKTGAPIQITLHDTLLGDVDDAAEARGRKDAEGGKFASNPYPAGSSLHERYKIGWGKVSAERIAGADEHPNNGAIELREEAEAAE